MFKIKPTHVHIQVEFFSLQIKFSLIKNQNFFGGRSMPEFPRKE